MGDNNTTRNKGSTSVLGLTLILITAIILTGCNNNPQPQSTSTSTGPQLPAAAKTYCGTPISVTGNSTTITATAQFKYRVTAGTGLLGISTDTISFVEVQVLDSSGNKIQCAETAADGSISLVIPRVAGTYSLYLVSRANNTKLKAYIIDDRSNLSPYFLKTDFTITSTDTTYNVGTITAEADEAISSRVEGGAFNILKNIYYANEHIRIKISNSSWVANLVTVYWKAGFNPASYYYGSSASGISFYLTGASELYILGGINNNVKSADTDHFDNSVILHEYGHFLEDIYGKSASPGGSHNGDFIIDPRLAWSEGWANYLQSSVKIPLSAPLNTYAKYYLDSIGYKSSAGDSTAGFSIIFDLSENPNCTGVPPSDPSYVDDSPCTSGEGQFRELSVSRTLYKSEIVHTNKVTFSDIWSAFTDLKSNLEPFSNFSRYLQLLSAKTSASGNTDFTGELSTERQIATTTHYATPVNLPGSACAKTITPSVDLFYGTSSLPRSNLFTSNDSYRYDYSGGGETIKLVYTTTNNPGGSSLNVDLDLYLYYQDHTYTEDQTIQSTGIPTDYIAKYSRTLNTGVGETEQFSLAGLPSGKYLIVVKGNTLGKTSSQLQSTATYQLYKNTGSDAFLCPNP